MQVWMYWLAGIAIMTGIGVVIWRFSRPKPGPGREFISAHPVQREGDQ